MKFSPMWKLRLVSGAVAVCVTIAAETTSAFGITCPNPEAAMAVIAGTRSEDFEPAALVANAIAAEFDLAFEGTLVKTTEVGEGELYRTLYEFHSVRWLKGSRLGRVDAKAYFLFNRFCEACERRVKSIVSHKIDPSPGVVWIGHWPRAEDVAQARTAFGLAPQIVGGVCDRLHFHSSETNVQREIEFMIAGMRADAQRETHKRAKFRKH
ncbi:MAG: hypothetical protein ABL904_16585 [Hyphomicrobiaceae bacterium]